MTVVGTPVPRRPATTRTVICNCSAAGHPDARAPYYWRPYHSALQPDFAGHCKNAVANGCDGVTTQNAVVNDYDGGRDTSSTASGYDPYGLKTQLLTGASGPSVHQL